MVCIKLNYLYRDYSNYKKYSSALFANPSNLSLEAIEAEIRKHLLDDTWFIHSQWNLPDLHFEKVDWEQDHPYHEFGGLEITNQNSKAVISTIEEFLGRMRKAS